MAARSSRADLPRALWGVPRLAEGGQEVLLSARVDERDRVGEPPEEEPTRAGIRRERQQVGGVADLDHGGPVHDDVARRREERLVVVQW